MQEFGALPIYTKERCNVRIGTTCDLPYSSNVSPTVDEQLSILYMGMYMGMDLKTNF